MKRTPSGVMVSRWELVEPSRRNECLDTMLYSEAAARKLGWTAKTESQWDALEAQRGIAPPEAQGDLFDAAPSLPAPLSERAAAAAPRPPEPQATPPAPATAPAASGGWLGPRKGNWL